MHEFEEGQVVEVSTSASESNPSGWSLGKINAIKKEFYFIDFVAMKSSSVIVEKEALRPESTQESLDATGLVRKVVPVPPVLRHWMTTPDARGCLSHAQGKAKLLLAKARSAEEVLLIGSERACELGAKLIELIHFKLQSETQAFSDQREIFLQRLEEKKQWYTSQHWETFWVDRSFAGRVIGKAGANLKEVREAHEVAINLEEGDQLGVTITGLAENVRAAREQLEFVTDSVPIEEAQIGWVLGKSSNTLANMASRSGVDAQFDHRKRCVNLWGLKEQVVDAKLMIKAHVGYLPVYRDMEEDQQTMDQHLQGLSAGKKGRKGKGRRTSDSAW